LNGINLLTSSFFFQRLNTVDSSLKEYGPLIVSSKLKLDFLQNMLETTRAGSVVAPATVCCQISFSKKQNVILPSNDFAK